MGVSRRGRGRLWVETVRSVGIMALVSSLVWVADAASPWPNAVASAGAGAATVINSTPEDLVKTACNGAPKPGATVLPPCVPEGPLGGSSPTQLRVKVRRRAHLFVSVVAGIDNEGVAESHATLSYALILDKRAVRLGSIMIAGGQQEELPDEVLLPVSHGSHTVGFQIRAEYSGCAPGDVIVAPLSIVVLPVP
jgi:hypothetical protein